MNRAPAAIVVALWGVSQGALIVAFAGGVRPRASILPGPSGWRIRPRRLEIPALAFLLMAAFLPRVWSLVDVPFGPAPDELFLGNVAVDALAGRGPHPLDLTPNLGANLPGYAIVPAIATLPDRIFALRFVAALMGCGLVLALYLLVRSWFGVVAGFAAALLAALSAPFLQFSRLGLTVIAVPVLFVLATYCLWQAERLRNAGLSCLAGILAGWTAYLWPSALMPVWAILILAAWLGATSPDRRGYSLAALGAATAGVIVSVIPLAVHALAGDRLAILAEHESAGLIFFPRIWSRAAEIFRTESLPLILWQQVGATLGVFTGARDRGPFFGYADVPLVTRAVTALAVLGGLIALRHIARREIQVLLIWLFVGFGLGGILTLDSPSYHRLLTPALAVFVLAALALSWIARLNVRLLPGLPAGFAIALAVAVPMGIGFDESQSYFDYVAKRFAWPALGGQASFYRTFGTHYNLHVLAANDAGFDQNLAKLIAPDVRGSTLFNPGAVLPVADAADRDTAFLVYPSARSDLPLLREFYPTARVEAITGPGGREVVTVTIVPREAVAADQGLIARYGDRRVRDPDPAHLGREAGGDRVDASWTGAIFADRLGRHVLSATGPGTTLAIAGVSGVGSVAPILTPGWHQLTIRATLAGPDDAIGVRWQPPDQPVAPLPAHRTIARDALPPLRGTIPAEDGRPFDRRDQAIAFRRIGDLGVARTPADLTWTGSFRVTAGGRHEFGVDADGGVQLLIDDRPVIATPPAPVNLRTVTGTVELAEGDHRFSLAFRAPSGFSVLRLSWLAPGGVMRLLLPSDFVEPGG